MALTDKPKKWTDPETVARLAQTLAQMGFKAGAPATPEVVKAALDKANAAKLARRAIKRAEKKAARIAAEPSKPAKETKTKTDPAPRLKMTFEEKTYRAAEREGIWRAANPIDAKKLDAKIKREKDRANLLRPTPTELIEAEFGRKGKPIAPREWEVPTFVSTWVPGLLEESPTSTLVPVRTRAVTAHGKQAPLPRMLTPEEQIAYDARQQAERDAARRTREAQIEILTAGMDEEEATAAYKKANPDRPPLLAFNAPRSIVQKFERTGGAQDKGARSFQEFNRRIMTGGTGTSDRIESPETQKANEKARKKAEKEGEFSKPHRPEPHRAVFMARASTPAVEQVGSRVEIMVAGRAGNILTVVSAEGGRSTLERGCIHLLPGMKGHVRDGKAICLACRGFSREAPRKLVSAPKIAPKSMTRWHK